MDTDTRPSFGSLLKEHRVARRLSQEALAERAGLSREAVSALERGTRLSPRRDTVASLAKILKLSSKKQARLVAAAVDQRGRTASATRLVVGSPASLPMRLVSFIGREQEIAEVQELVLTKRLLTLTGPGGIGKTSLALAVAEAVRAQFADGVALVELAALSDGELVPSLIAATLGVHEQRDQPLLTALGTALGTTQRLVVLDNCEHLLEGCAHAAEALLRACPRLWILATSREPLRVGAEVVWRVPSLTLPEGDTQNLEDLGQSEAVRLFIERAEAARPAFCLSAQNAASVGEICRHLDGIPLAIELAAARLSVLPVEQIARHLSDRFRLLTSGSRTVLPRHQTLRALIDWSYDLLTASERTFLSRLSVFAGDFPLDAAEVVCGDAGEVDGASSEPRTPIRIPQADVLELLVGLVDKSLVLAAERQGEARYRLQETLRQYGWERLVAAGEAASAQDRHRDWCVALAEQAASEIVQRDQREGLARIEREHDNLRAALAWCLESDRNVGVRLAGSLWRFWRGRGYVTEGRRWLNAVLSSLPRPTSDVIEASLRLGPPGTVRAIHGSRARAILGAGNLALDQGDYREAQSLVAQSLTLFREIDDREGTAHALRDLAGIMLLFGGESQQIRCVLEESLAVAEGVGDERGIGLALLNLGRLAAIERDGRRATDLTEDSLIRFRRLADEWSTGQALWMLGWLAWLRGDREQAQRHLREHLDIAHRLEDKPGVGFGLLASAILACSAADLRGAHANLAGSIRLLQELASPTLNDAFSVAGHVAVQEGDLIRGTRLLAVGTTGRPPRGPLWSLLIASWRADWEVSIALARSALGEEPFASVWAEGQAMPLVQAISDALGEEADEAPG